MAIGTLAAIALATTAVATVASIDQQQKAGRAAQRQAEAERRRAEVENVYKVRQSIRQARLAQGAMTNQAALSGGIGSSGLAGGTSSIGSQLSGNLNYMSQIAEENTSIFNAAVQGARASTNAAVFGQIGQMSSTIFSGMTGQSPGQFIGAKMAGK